MLRPGSILTLPRTSFWPSWIFRPVDLAQLTMQTEEGFLGGVLSILNIAREPQRQRIDPPFVKGDERKENVERRITNCMRR
jgi:hypothetical protein